MLRVNQVGDSLTGSINGKPFGIAFSRTKYEKLLELQESVEKAKTVEEAQVLLDQASVLVTADFQELIDHFTPFLKLNKEKVTYHLCIGDKVSPVALPSSIVKRIEESVSKNIDITPLVKGAMRMLRNPKLSPEKLRRFGRYVNMIYVNDEFMMKLINDGISAEVAKERATTFQTPFTREGLLSTYKVSAEITTKFVKDESVDGGVKSVERFDFEVDEFTGLKTYKKPKYAEDLVFQPAVMGTRGDAFACESLISGDVSMGHIIKVGHLHYLTDWSQVNCNDNQSCVPGLHVGGLDYIRGFQNANTITHDVFIDPMDIGAIPDDSTGAIRVKRYFVHRSFAGVNKNIYHSSKFAAITDAEFKEQVKQAVAASKEKYEQEASKWDALMSDS